jgi:hypothetical protein
MTSVSWALQSHGTADLSVESSFSFSKVKSTRHADPFSGASAIAIIDLNQADADAAAADLVDWFGEFTICTPHY